MTSFPLCLRRTAHDLVFSFSSLAFIHTFLGRLLAQCFGRGVLWIYDSMITTTIKTTITTMNLNFAMVLATSMTRFAFSALLFP